MKLKLTEFLYFDVKIVFVVFVFFLLGINSKYTGFNFVEVAQKSMFLLLSILLIFRNGFDLRMTRNYIFFFCFSFFCFLFSEDGAISFDLFLYSFISMSSFYLFCSVKSAFVVSHLFYSMKIIPFLMFIFSFILSVFTEYPFFVTEFTGAFRLSAGIDPAHFAIIIFYSVCFTVFEAHLRKRVDVLSLVLLLLLIVLTGARGPLIASFIVCLSLYSLRSNREVISFLKIGAIPMLLIFGYFIGNIIHRTFNEEVEGMNLSGREYAWEFLINSFDKFNLFGRGLGAVTVSTAFEEENNISAFIAPHNEYIRFWYDLGIFGVILFFANFLSMANKSFLFYRKDYGFFGFFLLVSILFFCFFDNVFSTHHSFLPLAILISFTSINRSEVCLK